MAALTSDQITRVLEFQSDFCALVVSDFQNPNFTQWYEDYEKYVKYGSQDSRGADRPSHKPPTP